MFGRQQQHGQIVVITIALLTAGCGQPQNANTVNMRDHKSPDATQMNSSPKDPAAMMREMRNGWLTNPVDKSKHKDDEVVAVVMDWPVGEQIVTILASSSGDASLYTTSTFGIIGGIGHENVRQVAKAFVATAQNHLTIAHPTSEYPYPDNKTVDFYMVTAGGVRTVSFSLEAVQKPNSAAQTLFDAGQQVMTQLRLITPQQRK